MKSTIYVFTTVACFALTSLTSVRAEDAKPSNMEPWYPEENKTVDCPNYGNCTNNTCHFNGTIGEIADKKFFPGDYLTVKCESLTANIKYPVTKDPDYVGHKNYSCFKYDNGNGISFSVAEVHLTKPEDVNRTQVICTSNQNNCTVLNDTGTQLILVAGFPSSCTPLAPPTPPTTGGSTAASVTPTPAPSGSTASPGGVEATTKPSSSSVARLEFAAVLAMAVALFIRHCL